MAQKIVGYREMLWTCPNCGAKNPGSVRVCKSCGAAMPEDTKFEQQIQADMISDEKILEQAKRGPDIYCAYCGNRNPAGSKTCSRCGADLEEGHAREHGSQHSAHLNDHKSEETVICQACGTANPVGTLKCKTCGSPLSGAGTQKEEIPAVQTSGNKGGMGRGCIFLIIGLIVLGILAFVLFGGGGNGGSNATPIPNQVLNAVVTSQNWQTNIQVIGPVDSWTSSWESNMPSDARNISCEDRLYATYDEEVRGSVEVCGTPYAIDLGNGYEQFTQDCVYEVYRSYCEYTVLKAGVIETRRASGSGTDVQYAYVEPEYSTGNTSESYSITLRDENGQEYTINPSTLSDYRSYSVGSEYTIEVNSRGRIVNMEKK